MADEMNDRPEVSVSKVPWQDVELTEEDLAFLTALEAGFLGRAEAFEADFDEDKHPRDEHGRWTSGGGGGAWLDKPSAAYTPMRPAGLDTKEKFSDGRDRKSVV